MQAIRGREDEIYSRFVPPKRRHTRCPFPSHEDRNPSFRLDSRTGRWFCTCGSGDVFDFIQRIGFAHNAGAAAVYVRDALGLPPIAMAKETPTQRAIRDARLAQARNEAQGRATTAAADQEKYARRQLAKARHLLLSRPYVLPRLRRLTPDVHSRVARIGRAEPHTRRASRGQL
jgi:hypothetical protein